MQSLWLPIFCTASLAAQTGTLRPEVTPPENPALRSEAVHLLERANMVSSPIWPANEEFFSFRILDPAPGEAPAGDIKIGVAKPTLKRWEFTYGQYSFVQVQNGSEYATLRSQPTEPAPLTSVRKIIPVGLGSFEQISSGTSTTRISTVRPHVALASIL